MVRRTEDAEGTRWSLGGNECRAAGSCLALLLVWGWHMFMSRFMKVKDEKGGRRQKQEGRRKAGVFLFSSLRKCDAGKRGIDNRIRWVNKQNASRFREEALQAMQAMRRGDAHALACAVGSTAIAGGQHHGFSRSASRSPSLGTAERLDWRFGLDCGSGAAASTAGRRY